jgi:thiamine biosynthesis lipoprotein
VTHFIRAIPTILIPFAFAVAAGDELQRYSRSEVHMAVDFEIVLFAAGETNAEEALSRAMARIAELDNRLSDYDPGSELSKLSESSTRRDNLPSSNPTVKVSDDLWRVLLVSQEISKTTDGAFDITIGPLTKLWRRARRWKELPETEAIDAARSAVGLQSLKLDPNAHTAQLMKPNMRLDLGGIAKGFAVDEAVKTVKGYGISRVLVRASGDIVAADAPPNERGWRVGIAPLDPDEPTTRFVEIANCAISTSGDSRQHLIVNGRRYSHIIDPRSGEPVSGRSSVTVIAPSGMFADAIATAASVVGPDQAAELAPKFSGVELFMVYEDESGRQRTVESDGFKRFSQQ